MSFRNTKTPVKSEITGKARYQCPMCLRHGQDAYYLTPELEAHFRRLFPITMNRDMMRLFGISFSTLQRFKREFGLEKKMKIIRHKQAQLAKRICEANGYYDSLRGKPVSEACIEASRKKRAEGFNPWQQLRKTNIRKYRKCMQQKSEQRKELLRRERTRVNWGLEQYTNLHVPFYPYGKNRLTFRSCCKAKGYIPGDARIESERWIIYYNEDTIRGRIREKNGEALGFKFVNSNPKTNVPARVGVNPEAWGMQLKSIDIWNT